MFQAPSTPAVVIDLNQVDNNIRAMVAGLSRHGIKHRPHTKTHKSLYFARRQMELGASAITVAKLGEAEVMVKGGLRDILVAFPIIGNDKLRRLGNLMGIADITTIVNSIEGAEGLSRLGSSIRRRVQVLIDIDGGMNRGGIKPMGPALEFARAIKQLPGIEVVGLMYYNGMLSGMDGEQRVKEALRERDEMLETAALLKGEGFQMRVLSGGSSYSSKLPAQIAGLTEARAGTYIFNDATHLAAGDAMLSECALTVQATVVSVVDDYNFIIDAGSKTLSSDLCGARPGYGYVVELPDAEIIKLNEEHGFVRTKEPHRMIVSRRVSVIPNHCCVVMNLADAVIGVRDGKYERNIPIEARGMNQ